jgi:DNA-binding transcriptional LysR family regulator
MAGIDQIRTFVEVVRTGNVTAAARRRGLSQPTASQHIRSLESVTGTALFVRRRYGMEPTDAGRALYRESVEPLAKLDTLLHDLDRGRRSAPQPVVRVGGAPELLMYALVPMLAASEVSVTCRVGSDASVLDLLVAGDIDVAITRTSAPRRGCTSSIIGSDGFALVSPPGSRRVRTLDRLGPVLSQASWVAFSDDMPVTRRFWRDHLGTDLTAQVRMVAPDERLVLAAVQAGLGSTLLSRSTCAAAIEAGTVVERYDVSDLIAPQPISASLRHETATRAEIRALLSAAQ